jgi:hypothetical protein
LLLPFYQNYEDDEDPWGAGGPMEAFNAVDLCARYTERLSRDILQAGASIFGSDDAAATDAPSSSSGGGSKYSGGSSSAISQSPEMDRLQLSKDDFDGAKAAFANVLRAAFERLASIAQPALHDAITATFATKHGMGVKFDESDATFDNQVRALCNFYCVFVVDVRLLTSLFSRTKSPLPSPLFFLFTSSQPRFHFCLCLLTAGAQRASEDAHFADRNADTDMHHEAKR